MTETTLKRLLQIGIVVPDAPQAAKSFCTLFALAESTVEIIDTTQTAQPIRVHGQVVTAGLIFELYNDGLRDALQKNTDL